MSQSVRDEEAIADEQRFKKARLFEEVADEAVVTQEVTLTEDFLDAFKAAELLPAVNDIALPIDIFMRHLLQEEESLDYVNKFANTCKYFARLVWKQIHQVTITPDTPLVALARMSNLERLTFALSPSTQWEESLVGIERVLPRLTHLHAIDTNLNKILALNDTVLKQLTQLRELSISGANKHITADGLRPLVHLRKLHLPRNADSSILSLLPTLTKLEWLHCGGWFYNPGRGFALFALEDKTIAPLVNLQALDLGWQGALITEEGLRPLTQLRKLKLANMHSFIEDPTFLEALTLLEELDLREAPVGFQLQDMHILSMPRLKIIRWVDPEGGAIDDDMWHVDRPPQVSAKVWERYDHSWFDI